MSGAYKFRSYARRRVIRLIGEIDKMGAAIASLAETYDEGYPDIAQAFRAAAQPLIITQEILAKLKDVI